MEKKEKEEEIHKKKINKGEEIVRKRLSALKYVPSSLFCGSSEEERVLLNHLRDSRIERPNLKVLSWLFLRTESTNPQNTLQIGNEKSFRKSATKTYDARCCKINHSRGKELLLFKSKMVTMMMKPITLGFEVRVFFVK